MSDRDNGINVSSQCVLICIRFRNHLLVTCFQNAKSCFLQGLLYVSDSEVCLTPVIIQLIPHFWVDSHCGYVCRVFRLNMFGQQWFEFLVWKRDAPSFWGYVSQLLVYFIGKISLQSFEKFQFSIGFRGFRRLLGFICIWCLKELGYVVIRRWNALFIIIAPLFTSGSGWILSDSESLEMVLSLWPHFFRSARSLRLLADQSYWTFLIGRPLCSCWRLCLRAFSPD